MQILRARYIYPVTGPMIEDAYIAIDNDCIVSLGPFSQLINKYKENEIKNLGECIILPGFINAHTHLELSYLEGKVPYDGDFIQWVKSVISNRFISDMDRTVSIQQGCKRCIAGGATTIADISHDNFARNVLADISVRSVCFAECFGMTENVEYASDMLDSIVKASVSDNDLLKTGISPHAPYSASEDVYHLADRYAKKYDYALTTHLAETKDELEFLVTGQGPWRRQLIDMNKWDGSFKIPGKSPVEYFLSMDHLGLDYLLAHLNYVSDRDIQLLARTSHSVVFCPGSHAFFGHKDHRFMDMLDSGINVCLGTDSLASNDTLSILDEVRRIYNHYPSMKGRADDIFKMATLNGAKALGLLDVTGSLEPGKAADLIVIPLEGLVVDPLRDVLVGQNDCLDGVIK